jgi:glycosyltransferase involved in cell wall biosynthesis
MNQSRYPLVSVGLPVYNGAEHLQLAIDSILKQSYKNIELIVCDNASTDETARIAERSASQDKRVKFIKNDRNIGIFNNFGRVLRESSGEYFMWAAYDDLHSHDFINECLKNLFANPNAVLCQTRVAVCLENPDQIIYQVSLNSFNDKSSVEERYKETLYNFPAVAIYGLYKSDIAKRIPGFRNIPGGDLLWVQELSLAGEFTQSDKVLFQYIARTKWNSFENDLKNLGSQSAHFRHAILRALASLFDRIESILRSETSAVTKIRLMVIAVQYSLRTVYISFLLRSLGCLGSAEFVGALKNKLYWRFLHNPNIEIVDKNIFQKRVINPSIRLL